MPDVRFWPEADVASISVMQSLYLIAFPEMAERDAHSVEALRASHDPVGHSMLKAHFTFMFGCTGVSAEIAAGVMQSVATGTGPIDFRLSQTVQSQHDKLHYVFLCPDKGGNEMRELHRRLHSGPLAACLDSGRQFTPHLTICKSADPEHARVVSDQLNRHAIHMDGRIRTLSLGVLEQGTFKVLERSILSGSA